MHRAALLAHEDVAQGVLLEQRVVDRQYRAAGIAEDQLDALVHQRLEYDFRAGQFGAEIGRGGVGDGGHRISLFRQVVEMRSSTLRCSEGAVN